jgi:glucokinase
MPVLGVDVGGTKIAAGVVSENAEILESVAAPTRAGEGYEVSLKQVYAAIRACLREDVSAIGICAPGPLNPKTGVVLNPPNLPGWRDVPLAKLVAEEFHRPCRVENDANAAGLAETRFGAARGCTSVFYVTLSTGIGTGIILDGRIYHGQNGQAGEGGHVTIDYASRTRCGCGLPGCIEALASGPAMARRGMPPEAIAAAVEAGEPRAVEILEETAQMLAAWLGGMISLLDPEIVVIGGGVSEIGEPLFARLRRMVPRRTINQFAAATPIVPAQLGANAGILGAAAIVLSS